MKKTIALLAGICIILGCLVVANFGVTKGQIEKEIQEKANIDTGWLAEYEISKDMATSICYDKKTGDYDCDIYVNYPGLSFGYFFKQGGNFPEIEEGIAKYEIDQVPAVAFVSMNKQKVSKITVGSGEDIEMIVINPKKPFAVVVEKEKGMIRNFDVNDEPVEAISI